MWCDSRHDRERLVRRACRSRCFLPSELPCRRIVAWLPFRVNSAFVAARTGEGVKTLFSLPWTTSFRAIEFAERILLDYVVHSWNMLSAMTSYASPPGPGRPAGLVQPKAQLTPSLCRIVSNRIRNTARRPISLAPSFSQSLLRVPESAKSISSAASLAHPHCRSYEHGQRARVHRALDGAKRVRPLRAPFGERFKDRGRQVGLR